MGETKGVKGENISFKGDWQNLRAERLTYGRCVEGKGENPSCMNVRSVSVGLS